MLELPRVFATTSTLPSPNLPSSRPVDMHGCQQRALARPPRDISYGCAGYRTAERFPIALYRRSSPKLPRSRQWTRAPCLPTLQRPIRDWIVKRVNPIYRGRACTYVCVCTYVTGGTLLQRDLLKFPQPPGLGDTVVGGQLPSYRRAAVVVSWWSIHTHTTL